MEIQHLAESANFKEVTSTNIYTSQAQHSTHGDVVMKYWKEWDKAVQSNNKQDFLNMLDKVIRTFDPNMQGHYDKVALQKAAKHWKCSDIELLLNAGDPNGTVPELYKAVINDDFEKLQKASG